MHLPSILRESHIYLSVISFAIACVALPVHTTSLTPSNFKDSTAKGLWFIEHYSPYCTHCRKFAPTWEQLVKAVEPKEDESPVVQLAQVNCAVHGDLCTDNGVQAYPTLTMFSNGQIVEDYKGSRDFDGLMSFIKRHAKSATPPVEPELPRAILNPAGEVLDLASETFATTLSQGPMFVKFFAPWCGHCKKLAPTWKQLARHMQNKLTVAQVDCDDHGALCKSHGVQGYPTLIYLTSEGVKSEYNGGRKLDQLKAFADKASVAGLTAIEPEELDARVADDDVVYLLLHSSSNTEILESVRKAGSVLLGSPRILTSSSPALFDRFSVPQTSTWALLALKDHVAHSASSMIYGHTSEEESLKQWLLSHRLSTTVELTQDTFQSVMNAPQSPLVVIAAVSKENKDKVKERFREVGKKWKVRTGGNGMANGREVIFAWMDAERWAAWMKSMYSISLGSSDGDLEDVPVIISDHQRLIYYDKDTTSSPITLASSASLFSAVEAAAAGKLSYKLSENTVERLARYLNTKMIVLEAYIVAYPLRTVFILGVIIVFVFLGIKRLVADDVSTDRDYRSVKTGRLD